MANSLADMIFNERGLTPRYRVELTGDGVQCPPLYCRFVLRRCRGSVPTATNSETVSATAHGRGVLSDVAIYDEWDRLITSGPLLKNYMVEDSDTISIHKGALDMVMDRGWRE